MGHIHEQVGTDLVRDLAEALEVQFLGVRGEASQNHFRLMRHRQALNLIVIDHAGLGVEPVLDRVVDLAGEVDAGAVGQVTAGIQAHAQHRVARLHQRQVDRIVG